MIERLKKAYTFVVGYYYSILLIAISIWLASVLFKVGHLEFGVVVLLVVTVKAIGLLLRNKNLRQIGIIGINILWAVNTYIFYQHHVPVSMTYEIPLFFLLLGTGIALRGRFNE